MFLKISFVLIFLTSCVRTIKNPVIESNNRFLSKNSAKIEKQKKKHYKIANENNIYYRDAKVDLVDNEYYPAARGTKLKKNYRGINESNVKSRTNIDYLDSDMSIYYKDRNLKDFSYLYDENNEDILFLSENYNDYSKDKVNFNDIEISDNDLYGSLESRMLKEYNYVPSDVMQRNFDYIDVMNRVRDEIYLKQKENNVSLEKEKKDNGTVNSLLDKFKNLFKKNN